MFKEGSDFAAEFSKCIFLKGTVDEFEIKWESLLERYDLKDNVWLNSMYNKRQKWVPVYLRNTFFANMQTTQRSESINSFFDGYVNSRTTLNEFVKQYERALISRREIENEEDYRTNHSEPVLKTNSSYEKQASKEYTRIMFEKFQHEVQCSEFVINKIGKVGFITEYELKRFITGPSERKKSEPRAYIVTYNSFEIRANCSCQMFEFQGIPCRHMISVFRKKNILMLPSCYLLKRWTRHAKTNVIFNEEWTTIEVEGQQIKTVQQNVLYYEAQELLKKASKSDRSCVVALNGLKRTIKELDASDTQDTEENGTTINQYSNVEVDHLEGETLYDPKGSKTKGQSSARYKCGLEINQKRKKRCSRCRKCGHNTRNCPNSIANGAGNKFNAF